jgi:hypothetical protein
MQSLLWGVLNAFGSVVALEEGRHAHECIIESGSDSDLFVGNSLIDIYIKCGSMDTWRVFDKMPTQNVVSWRAMLKGFAMHGYGKEALAHFKWMYQAGVEINSVMFVCLLSACSHVCLLFEGLHYFNSMGTVYSILPTGNHYACMVDLLGCS